MSAGFNCIAIETATSECSVAIRKGDEKIVKVFADASGSSRQVYKLITGLLHELGLSMQELSCVAFGCGPGSFTGVRVAASVAQGIAYACGVKVCRVSSLAAIAAGAARQHGAQNYAACLDARMGEAYLGVYSASPGARPRMLVADRLVDPAAFSLAESGGELYAVGPGWDAWPAMRTRNAEFIARVDAAVWPSAGDVLDIAAQQFVAGDYVDPVEALPNYVRDKVTQ